MSQIGIVGLGYVGLTSAVCFAELDHQVIGFDVDMYKVDLLRDGKPHIYEPGIEVLLANSLKAGRILFTGEIAELGKCEFVFLCVPTPAREDGIPDTSFLKSACLSLQDRLAPNAIVVTKSTVPIGTHKKVAEWLDRDDVSVVSNPEFLREGCAISDFLEPDRIVVGSYSEDAAARVAALYEKLNAPAVITDPPTSEMIKYAANTLLATKLSFMNEVARLSEAIGADSHVVANGVGLDHRIGTAFLQPGPGWGGSCFPKDTKGLLGQAQAYSCEMPVTAAAIAGNEAQVQHVVQNIVDMVPDISGATVGVWGLTFKANTDDVRDSPAINICERLRELGAKVQAFDPMASGVPDWIDRVEDAYLASADADVVVVLTEWDEFNQVDLQTVSNMMTTPAVYDVRNVLDPESARNAGLHLRRIGMRFDAAATT